MIKKHHHHVVSAVFAQGLA